jgi:hypothetical protein
MAYRFSLKYGVDARWAAVRKRKKGKKPATRFI